MDKFDQATPVVEFPPQITLRRSVDVLTEAYVTLATTYSNHIVLKFEQRVKNCLKYKISANFPVEIYFDGDNNFKECY